MQNKHNTCYIFSHSLEINYKNVAPQLHINSKNLSQKSTKHKLASLNNGQPLHYKWVVDATVQWWDLAQLTPTVVFLYQFCWSNVLTEVHVSGLVVDCLTHDWVCESSLSHGYFVHRSLSAAFYPSRDQLMCILMCGRGFIHQTLPQLSIYEMEISTDPSAID